MILRGAGVGERRDVWAVSVREKLEQNLPRQHAAQALQLPSLNWAMQLRCELAVRPDIKIRLPFS